MFSGILKPEKVELRDFHWPWSPSFVWVGIDRFCFVIIGRALSGWIFFRSQPGSRIVMWNLWETCGALWLLLRPDGCLVLRRHCFREKVTGRRENLTLREVNNHEVRSYWNTSPSKLQAPKWVQAASKSFTARDSRKTSSSLSKWRLIQKRGQCRDFWTYSPSVKESHP